MYPIKGYAYRKEPRQPEAKPPVVYTDQSSNYDDSATRSLIDETLRAEEETQPTKEKEPMGKRKRHDMKLPMGEQGDTVSNLIEVFATPGQDITATLVWSWFSLDTKKRWERAYGGHKRAYDKVRHAISNLSYSGRMRIVPSSEPGAWTYLGPGKGTPRSSRGRQKARPTGKVTTPKADNVPAPAPKAERVDGTLERFELVGYNLTGDPLYRDKRDGVVGTITFTPWKP